MTLDALIMLMGTLVAVLPFLGFPESWDTVLFLIAGISVIALGIVVRRRTTHLEHAHKRVTTFAESQPSHSSSSFGAEHEETA